MRQRCFVIALAFMAGTRCLTAQADIAYHGVIRGIVLDTLGHPYPGVVVHLGRLSIDVSPLGNTSGTVVELRSDTTDTDGRFEFTSLRPLVYRLAYYQSFLVYGRADSVALEGPADTVSVVLRTLVRPRLRETPDSVRNRRLAELADARARWDAHRVPRYRLAAQIDCFCFASIDGKATLEFRNDTLVRVNSRRGWHGPDVLPWFKSFSVPALFNEVEAAIRNRDVVVEAVAYDATYGFPTRLDTDTAYGFTDGWYRWRVKEFRPTR